MARTEHYYDPQAPKANSIVVATTAFVRDGDRVLLIRRTDNGLWSLPGGGQEIGEYLAETAVRETLEETGVQIKVVGLVGIYSDPNHVVAYTDGEIRQQFSVCLRGEYLGGEPTPSAESSDVRWVERAELEELAIHPSTRLRIEHGYDRTQPYIG
ncbi:NUDIX hydrolase [Catellatospora sp. IY07-71]|uniref:NUDIX hydrolase n=1 Tax=Catellatospora sp. IY07-71 TaxID=2728827 RepID=UPI001BB39214|nr:NUDIX domain-containing protein [Catellatospora sp. IY07-71]BCJ74496.1 NUDIX hydrolase [Catellatospora sp. IY07-71]